MRGKVTGQSYIKHICITSIFHKDSYLKERIIQSISRRLLGIIGVLTEGLDIADLTKEDDLLLVLLCVKEVW